MICFLFIPVHWLFFAASTYVWVQYVWHTGTDQEITTGSAWQNMTKQFCGSGMFIPYPDQIIFHSEARIQGILYSGIPVLHKKRDAIAKLNLPLSCC
jgi:hypothetical protein